MGEGTRHRSQEGHLKPRKRQQDGDGGERRRMREQLGGGKTEEPRWGSAASPRLLTGHRHPMCAPVSLFALKGKCRTRGLEIARIAAAQGHAVGSALPRAPWQQITGVEEQRSFDQKIPPTGM